MTTILKTTTLAALALTASLAAGCAPGQQTFLGGPKQTGGVVAGAVAGGLLGNQIGGGGGKAWATGLGIIAGGLLGSEIGKSLDRADQTYLAGETNRALETGQATRWNNPQSGNYGTVQPTPAYQGQYGQECRDFTQTIYIGGKAETGTGTACRQNDGTWRVTG